MSRAKNAERAAGPRRFKPYPTYKHSGVEWLGEIPAHWEVKRLRHVFRVVNGSTPASGELGYWDGTIPWVTPEDLGELSGPVILRTKRNITASGYRSCGTTLVPAGSLVLSTRAPIGHVAVAGVELCTNQGCRSLVFRNEASRQFFFYELLAARPELESLGQGSTFKELAKGMLEDVVLAEPASPEQGAVAAFLDRETARIDALVAKKERLIELLQEKRTALITRAVTQGLDPTVPMKTSEVGWLGEIPAHREVKPLKALSALQTGLTLGKKYEGRSLTTRPYLRVANVQDGYLALDDIAEVELPWQDAARYELQEGDVLMTEGGDFDKLGRGHVWEDQVPGCLHQNHIFAVRPRREVLRPRFLAFVMSSGYGRAYFTATSKQSTNLASTNSTKLRNLPMPVPSLSEQSEIVSGIDRETAKIDALVAKVREAIVHLKELRAALISAAVTGKIDVREEAAA